jgi:lipopolysaccharide export system protein LptA
MLSKSVFATLLCFLLGLTINAQQSDKQKPSEPIEEIELNHADRFTRDTKTPKGASKLIGNVSFTHKAAMMYCDSAYLFEDNSMKAYGHVRIVDGDSLTLKGDSLFYDGNTQLAKVRGNVIIDNKASILKTKFLDYDRATGKADYYGGGVIDSQKEKIHLVSQRGNYFSESKIFHFKKDVVMNHPDYVIVTDTMHYAPDREKTWFFGPTDITFDNRHIYCERGWFDQLADKAVFIKNAVINSSGQTLKGDTIEYDQAAKLGISKMNVVLIDSNENLEVIGDYAVFNEVDSTSLVTKNMMMKQEKDGDTFYLVGDTMLSVLDTNHHRVIKTFHHSRFYKSDMQGQCDSLVYLTNDSIIHMYKDPILWSDGSQITADSLYLTMKNQVLDRMYMNKNSFIISADDSVFYNQIKGRNMIGYFIDSELKKVDVFGNGQTIYYPREEDGFMIGINETKCANMTIKIDSNKIKSITFFEQPVAVLSPSDEMPADGKKLDGFVYKSELRPTSVADLLPSKYQQPAVKSNKPDPKKEVETAAKEKTQTQSTPTQSVPAEAPKSDVKVLKAGRKAKSKED